MTDEVEIPKIKIYGVYQKVCVDITEMMHAAFPEAEGTPPQSLRWEATRNTAAGG